MDLKRLTCWLLRDSLGFGHRKILSRIGNRIGGFRISPMYYSTNSPLKSWTQVLSITSCAFNIWRHFA
jgi:hypothetical protein